MFASDLVRIFYKTIAVRNVAFFVTKADGTKQFFDREKIVRTCLRLHASKKTAEEIAERIERRIYDGIETKEILQMIFGQLSKYNPAVRYQICLRKALSLMEPKQFERFIQILLSEHGYEVTSNQIIRGKCVEHEVDALARKSGFTYLVEVKHHYNYHTPTGLDESRVARAIFEDVTEGFELGLNRWKVDGSMIVVNTKFSDYAKRYAQCRKIHLVGWSSPLKKSLQTLIEERRAYPLQCLKGLNTIYKHKLTSAEILLIKQLAKENPEKLGRKTQIPEKTLETLIKTASMIVSS